MLLLVNAVPAHAENERWSYIQGWQVGHESNRWYDRNSDAETTAVALVGCSTDTQFTFASLTLYRVVDFAPDDSYGTKTERCRTWAWGDPQAGNYYFKLSGFTGGSVFFADSAHIRW
ncbi:hypothetical protein [Streptomyces sp. NPDC047315]|uniref:hypothetical protein n=1 Tax=Streptomyces sp. NPDC047315 TaxID=3155142 RepID=UPI0033EE2DE2